jgi:hypothetical protein
VSLLNKGKFNITVSSIPDLSDSFRADWDLVCEVANNALTEIRASSLMLINQALMAARIRVDSSYARLQHVEALVAHIEIQLSIEVQWEIGDENYKHFKEEASLSKYHTALDELERLIIMRLFELSKLLLSGTGKFSVISSLQR